MKYFSKTFSIITLLFLDPNNVFSQPIVWQRLYSDESAFHDGYSIIQLPDEGYIAVGEKNTIMGFKVLGMRLDKYGNLIWRKYYSGYNPREIVKTTDGNFFIGCSALTGSVLIKININGDTLWTRPELQSGNIKLTKDGGFYTCGAANVGSFLFRPYLRKYDSLGYLKWERIYDRFYQGAFQGFLINGKNEIVLVGNYYEPSVTPFFPFIMKTDSLGSPIWLRKYNHDSLSYFRLTQIQQDIYGDYIAGGNSHLVKFNSEGL